MTHCVRNLALGLACVCLLLPHLVSQESSSKTPAPAQQSNAPSSPPLPVFRSTTRMVLVDVVATDHHGQFLRGLKAKDFTVLEDGKPQTVTGFVVHETPATPDQAIPPLKLPPHQYSNFGAVPQESDRPVTIVLLDMVNTAGTDQQYARKQMVKFLEALPNGRPVALFTLTSQLKMVQGFTGDSATLVKAAKLVMANNPLTMGSEAQQQQEEVGAGALESIASPSFMGPTGGQGTSDFMPVAPIGQAIRDALDSEDTFTKLVRMDKTLDALETLGRAVAGYPGRKNLLWLSAEFPIAFGPNMNPYNQASQPINEGIQPGAITNHQLHNLEYETPPLQKTAALLAAAQVAVYPIAVTGIVNLGTGIDISSQTSYMSNLGLQQETQGAYQRQTTALWDTHEAMSDVARQTGGEAFYGTNDLKAAMERGMDEGSNYYTIAYNPANGQWKGDYRKIEVKADIAGAKLTYRRGYYAVETRPYTGDKEAAAMLAAMRFSEPEFTMVRMKAQVLPPDADHKAVRIDFAVNSRDITFVDGSDGRKLAAVDFVATAWDKDLKLVTHQAATMNATLSPDAFQQVRTTGLPYHQELELKPGTYTLRLGVLDRGSQRIGTLDVPLVVPEAPEATTKPAP